MKNLSLEQKLSAIFATHYERAQAEALALIAQEAGKALPTVNFEELWEGPRTSVITPKSAVTPRNVINIRGNYNPRTRTFTCPFCGTYADLRSRAVSTHMRFCPDKPQT